MGHEERGARRKKINNLLRSPLQHPDENLRVLIKKGPVSVETSLKELKEKYERKLAWKVIEEGGVLSIPVEEFRMIIPPKPNHLGHVAFDKKKPRKGTNVEDYTVGQTIEHQDSLVLSKYNEEKAKSIVTAFKKL